MTLKFYKVNPDIIDWILRNYCGILRNKHLLFYKDHHGDKNVNNNYKFNSF